LQEFQGWQATINGYTGGSLGNQDKTCSMKSSALFFDYGPDVELFDTDCDGISDLYESARMITYATPYPRLEDTDSDTLKDPSKSMPAWIPRTTATFTQISSTSRQIHQFGEVDGSLITDKPVTTLHWPKADIDGDGMTAIQE
jgi:hypothetical protein